MRTGEVNANLRECNDSLGSDRLGWINDLISQKIAGEEQSIVGGNDRLLYEREYRRYRALLVREGEASKLPQTPTAEFELRALLARIRDVGSVAA